MTKGRVVVVEVSSTIFQSEILAEWNGERGSMVCSCSQERKGGGWGLEWGECSSAARLPGHRSIEEPWWRELLTHRWCSAASSNRNSWGCERGSRTLFLWFYPQNFAQHSQSHQSREAIKGGWIQHLETHQWIWVVRLFVKVIVLIFVFDLCSGTKVLRRSEIWIQTGHVTWVRWKPLRLAGVLPSTALSRQRSTGHNFMTY